MRTTVEYLRGREWTMGNGQCHSCHGAPLEWLGHPLYTGREWLAKLGHAAGCPWAQMLEEAGEKVLRQGDIFPECWGRVGFAGEIDTPD